MKKILIYTFLSLIFASAAWADADIQSELNCFDEMSRVLSLRHPRRVDEFNSNGKVAVLIPAHRGKQAGFYLYASDGVFFYPLDPSKTSHHLMHKGLTDFTIATTSKNAEITTLDVTDLSSDKMPFGRLDGWDALDAGSVSLLRDRLRDMVEVTAAIADGDKGSIKKYGETLSVPTPTFSPIAEIFPHAQVADTISASLDKCAKVEGLSSLVAKAKLSLAKAYPKAPAAGNGERPNPQAGGAH